MLEPDLAGGAGGEADVLVDELLVHGSPTQNASMLPTFMLATICGGGHHDGGDVLVRDRRRRRQASNGSRGRGCRPEGHRDLHVLAGGFLLLKGGLSADASTPTLRSLYSFETEIACASRLSRAQDVHRGRHVVLRDLAGGDQVGIGVRCARHRCRSFPSPARRCRASRPRTPASTPRRRACRAWRNRPFSLAITSGEASISAM